MESESFRDFMTNYRSMEQTSGPYDHSLHSIRTDGDTNGLGEAYEACAGYVQNIRDRVIAQIKYYAGETAEFNGQRYGHMMLNNLNLENVRHTFRRSSVPRRRGTYIIPKRVRFSGNLHMVRFTDWSTDDTVSWKWDREMSPKQVRGVPFHSNNKLTLT